MDQGQCVGGGDAVREQLAETVSMLRAQVIGQSRMIEGLVVERERLQGLGMSGAEASARVEMLEVALISAVGTLAYLGLGLKDAHGSDGNLIEKTIAQAKVLLPEVFS